jgi:hypothetical protein
MATLEIDHKVLDVWSDKYNDRLEKVDGDLQNKLCIVCGRKVGDKGFGVWIVNGGDTLATPDSTDIDARGDMGWWPIGSECIKPVPEAFRVQLVQN